VRPTFLAAFLAVVKSLEFRPGTWARAVAIAAVTAIGAGAGCGDNDASSPDADPGLPPRLEVVPAGGNQRGLAPAAATELRVLYRDPESGPIAGAPVTFALVPGTGGSAGGATLSASVVATSGAGEAAVTLTAGPERADFRVIADAAPARVTFFVNVSAGGFATVRVAAEYRGRRDGAELGALELRAYHLPCAQVSPALDPEQVPPVLAPRTVPPDDAAWSEIPAGEAYTLLAWRAHAVSGRPIAAGCTELAPGQVLATDSTVHIAIVDEPLALDGLAAVSALDLAPLAAALRADGADRPWQILDCARGGGQLVLDWIVDALAGDGVLDGVVAGPLDGDAAAIAAQRGALGGDGCRAPLDGGPGLDGALDAILIGPGVPAGGARDALVAARAAAWSEAALGSRLDAAGPGLVVHRLAAARFGAITVDLAASARPVLAATAGWTLGPAGAVLARHAFTARLGAAAGAAFTAASLEPAGLEPDRLGAALVGSASAAGRTGCSAISALVCASTGLGDGCAAAACAAASAGLDDGLAAWWRRADGAGLDLAVSGTLVAADADGDLAVDPGAGTWTVELTPAAGPPITVPALVATEPP
jgi:hypothetical protein